MYKANSIHAKLNMPSLTAIRRVMYSGDSWPNNITSHHSRTEEREKKERLKREDSFDTIISDRTVQLIKEKH